MFMLARRCPLLASFSVFVFLVTPREWSRPMIFGRQQTNEDVVGN